MTKSIKEVVDEFKAAFGRVEFKATNLETGQVGTSRGWVDDTKTYKEMGDSIVHKIK